MINITFYGIDPYMLRGLSKDLTEKVANLCEVSKEDILFMSSDGLLCFNGVEQDDWYALIYVDMPHELEVFEKQFVELFKYHLDKAVLHFEVVFRYYHNHSHYVELNEDYPRYIDEKNQIFAENDEDGDNFKEVYNHEDKCDDPECAEHHHDDQRIYLGNAFEGFEEKLEEIKEKK